MTLKIISAQEILFEGDATVVHLPGTMGAFTVLPGHAALVSTLTPGKISYTTPDQQVHTLDTDGGVADVDHDVVSVCIY